MITSLHTSKYSRKEKEKKNTGSLALPNFGNALAHVLYRA
jgi:hypothetical protein